MQAPATVATAMLAAAASRSEQVNSIGSVAMNVRMNVIAAVVASARSQRMNVIAAVAASSQSLSEEAPKPGTEMQIAHKDPSSEMQIAHTDPIAVVTLVYLRPLVARATHPLVGAAMQLVRLVPSSIGGAPPQRLREDGAA